MLNGYSLDPHPKANFAKEHFATVVIPRLKRDRVPASSVEIVADLELAIRKSNIKKKLYSFIEMLEKKERLGYLKMRKRCETKS
jgi:hypothetical protein